MVCLNNLFVTKNGATSIRFLVPNLNLVWDDMIRKIYIVSWKRVFKLYDKGKLGLRSAWKLNEALILHLSKKKFASQKY